MHEYTTVVTRKGQITVPAAVRRAMGLKEGDSVVLTMADANDAQATLRPVRSVAERTFGIAVARKRPEDFHELRRTATDEIAENAAHEHEPAMPA